MRRGDLSSRVVNCSITILAASVAAATAIGFWLSYAGLHGFAELNGLYGAEAWAFPASVDLFILAGELGITISAIRHRKDWAAWVYLALGFGASVAFNILHVKPIQPGWGPYAVAAVPPVAAMLALAALMRQVYRLAVDTGATQAHSAYQIDLARMTADFHDDVGTDLPPWLNGHQKRADPDATVILPAIHDVGDATPGRP